MKFFFTSEEKKVFVISIGFFLLIVAAEIIGILILNSGLIVYTTDDAYIHLALAENILKGHYGVNLYEYSSPSSSIIWPVILAPFTAFSFGYLLPLVINIISSIGSVLIIYLVLRKIFLTESPGKTLYFKITLLLMILLIIGTNLVGSVFIGMEHSLQVFLTLLIILGLILFIKDKNLPGWLLPAIVIAPLIRYENLALSFSALIFLYLTGYKKKSLAAFSIIILVVIGFSFFLLELGLKPLPLSVLQKSSVISEGSFFPVLLNLKQNLLSPRGVLLLVGAVIFLFSVLSKKRKKEEKMLAGFFALAVLAHLLIGKDGRYIIYIWAASLLVFLFLYKEKLIKIISKIGFIKTAVIFSALTLLISYYYIVSIITIPVGSNNIYEQQYQMHRFVTEYYKKPVAVNDLGYVSYNNDNYVLDLVGLASQEALNYQHTRKTFEWIDTLSRKYNVELAMIYKDWFDPVPANWYKIAELQLGKIKMAASRDRVSFYLLDKENKNEVISLLIKFKETLPEGVRLIINEKTGVKNE